MQELLHDHLTEKQKYHLWIISKSNRIKHILGLYSKLGLFYHNVHLELTALEV